jgi:transposase
MVGDRNVAQEDVWQAAIILFSANGLGTHARMPRTGKSKTSVWRWQERFKTDGVDRFLRNKTRPSRIPPLGPEVAVRVVALTLVDPPLTPPRTSNPG